MSEKYSLIYTVFPDAEQAKKVAHLLLKDKLIACANILPPHVAIYEWEGELREDSEVIMFAKTIGKNFLSVQTKILELHTYENPCVLEIPLTNIAPEFSKWICNTVKFT